jgi:arylsulfatase A-like enzyme
MRRRVFAISALVALFGTALVLRSWWVEDGAGRRPNVVLIVIDTLRADKLGVYGFGAETSPELDAYARSGVRFAEVLAQSSWTRASIGSMLTSLHPRSLGIVDEEEDALGERVVTLAEILQQHGYWTVGATANPNLNRSFNFHQGFEDYVDSNVLWEWMPDEADKAREPERPIQPGPEIYGALLARIAKSAQRPYYAQVNVMEVHEASNERAPRERYPDLFHGQQDRAYLQAVRLASRDADAFLRGLSELPGVRNTLFVITSDHGEGLSDHPNVGASRLHGLLLYESQLRVPLILYSTAGDLPAGRVVARPVRLLDLMPTILDYVGLTGPEGMEGRSLLPLIREGDEAVELPETFFAETRFRHHNKIAAYTKEWKYIENRVDHRGTPPWALHRRGLVEDGWRTDLSRGYPAVVNRLTAQLREWERAHPTAASTPRRAPLSAGEVAQLRALGYAD